MVNLEREISMSTYYSAEEAKELILAGNAPSHMRVSETLDLNDCGVEVLPDFLEVDGNLLIADNPISNLPKGLVVDGHLYITDTEIEDVPSDTVVTAEIVGGPGQMDIINEKMGTTPRM